MRRDRGEGRAGLDGCGWGVAAAGAADAAAKDPMIPLLTVLQYGCTVRTGLHKCTYIDTVDDGGRIAGALHMPGWAYEDDGG